MKKLFTSSGTLWSCFIALVMMMAAQSASAQYVPLTALDGQNAYNGGDEHHEKLVDGNDGLNGRSGTKWGTWYDPTGFNPDWPLEYEAYIIVKASSAVVPDWYFLVTGNDSNGARNWKSWKIYGGNFVKDADAVREGEGWTLIDEREDGGLPMANFAVKEFQFNKSDGQTAYRYFWIEITDCVAGGEVYLQMEEWGLGLHSDYQNYLNNPTLIPVILTTGTDLPLEEVAVTGSRNDLSGEGLAKLFDNNIDTKWGTGLTAKPFGSTEGGCFAIFETSRPIAPTYYKLVTGTDNALWKHRNWHSWQIYGIADADVDFTSNTIPRNSNKWVMLDKKLVTEDVLPDENRYTVYFDLSEENTTAYRFFKVEIDSTMAEGGSGYMQMGELALGDEYTFAVQRNAAIAAVGFDPNIFAKKTLVDSLEAAVNAIDACTRPDQVDPLKHVADSIKNLVDASAAQYAQLVTARNQAIQQMADDNVADAAIAYVQGWIDDTNAIAPNDDYPCGNFAYIKANRQLTGEQAVAEANRINAYLLANVNTVENPIGGVGYVFLSGTTDNWNNTTEGPAQLIDGKSGINGTESTKWGTATSGDRFVIFKTTDNTPIKPTYYGLVTGGDTHIYTDRNWKNWKIWAANFDSDEDAVKDADGWVLIDEKNNVGTDVLKTTSLFESYIYLSEGCAVPYTYFKIEVYHNGGMQMNEFTFYNQGDFVEYRQNFIDEFANFDADSQLAYPGYITDFKAKYEELCNASNAPDLMSIKNQVQDNLNMILESVRRYELYEEVYDELLSTGPASEALEDWFSGYTTQKEGPGTKYLRGTHDYIMDGYVLNNEELGQLGKPEDLNPGAYPASGEIGYIQNMIDAAIEDRYILLGGHTDNQWGDGFYGNLIDGVAINDTLSWKEENGKQVPDQVRLATKWGGNSKGANNTFEDTYIIFRTAEATNPYFYTLTTGNDTGTYTGRNWGTWYIYGANFAGDGDATADADGWDLIDSKENTGQDRLHPVNCQPSFFGFSSETTEKYVYYKVVVTKAYSGSQIQMNELHFGTEEEFDVIRDEYADKAREFDYNVIAYQGLIDEYDEKIDSIENCINMEVLFRLNASVNALQPEITASKAVYARYAAAVDAAKNYLQEYNLTESEAKTIFANYLNTNEGPDDDEEGIYPNGTALYILETHELNDSIVNTEIEFLESLKAAAVAEGYDKGMDISSLIVNRTFAVASSTQNDEQGNALGREAEGWDGYIYSTATDSIGKIFGAEFYNYLAKFNVSQTLTNLKNGFYKVTLNAAYRSNGDLLSFNYAPFAYANDVQTFIPVIREEAYEDSVASWQGANPDHEFTYQDESAADVTVWGMWGCEGAAHAFTDGRYAITLVAEVTDGTLTIGVKNDGTKGNEWTAVGNFGLWYLGEDAQDQVVTDALTEVAEYNAARIATLLDCAFDVYDENYVNNPNVSAAQRTVLENNCDVATYAAAKLIGETMQAVYETKKAYGDLFEAANKVYDKWEEAEVNLYDEMEAAVELVRSNLFDGIYETPEAVLAEKETLYAQWPDYLEPKKSNDVISASNVDIEQTNFEFTMEATGNRPWIELYKFYEALDKKEIVLAFDYTAEQNIENSQFWYLTPSLNSKPVSVIPALEAAAEWTTVYYNVSEAIKALQFGSATDHGLRWYITYGNVPEGESLKLQARNFRMMTIDQVKAAGGKLLNGLEGDVNDDLTIDVADAQTILIMVADGSQDPKADINGDGNVDLADVQTVLIMIADQQ